MSIFSAKLATVVKSVADNPPPVAPAPLSNIARQLEIVKGLMGYKYGDEQVDRLTTDYIVQTLTKMGVRDIRELSVRDFSETLPCTTARGGPGNRTEVASSQTVGGYYFVNKQTGGSVTPKFYTTSPNSPDENPTCGTHGLGVPIQSDGAYRFGLDVLSEYYDENSVAGKIGDNVIFVWVKFTADGIPYFFAQLFNTIGMHWTQAVRELATIVFAAASLAIPGVNAALAQYIFGSVAVAYPVAAAAMTNVMISTALNGGDVEAAVKSVATSYLGSQVGGVVAGVSDSEAIGKLAGAAATAAARGGDVERAVLTAAVQVLPSAISGAMSDVPSSNSMPYHDPVYDPPTVHTEVQPMPSIFDIPDQPPVFEDVDYSGFDFGVGGDISGFDFDNLPIELSGDPMFDPGAALNAGSLDVPLAPGVLEPMENHSGSALSDVDGSFDASAPDMVPLSAPSGFQTLSNESSEGSGVDSENESSFFGDLTFKDVVSGIGDVATALLRVNAAYQAAGRPSVQPYIRTTTAGVTQTVRADGTIVSTDPATGRSTVSRPPVGTPFVLPDGSLLTNNGDGTYTTIGTSGARTSNYPPVTSQSGSGNVFTGSTMVAGVPNWAIAGGIGALAIALLSSRR